MDCRKLGSSVLHYLLEFTQIHVHRVGDAIQPSRPLSSPSLPALNLPQHQGLSQWVSSSHQVAKVLELQLQLQSFQWIFIYNGILFSHEQGWNNAICGNMTGSTDYHPTWSQPDRERPNTWYHLHVESKLQHRWTYLQNRDRLADMKATRATKRESEEGWIRSLGLADTNYAV